MKTEVGCKRSGDLRIDIPDGLSDLLRDFTVAVLQNRPQDLLQFASKYFSEALAERNSVSRPLPMYVIVDQEEAQEPDKADVRPLGRMTHYSRRQSVSAERYDPELDDSDNDEGTPRVVHPKSDANRKSLVNSMKDILIFKSLDQEQLNEVVDAMFERKVVGGEHVITQGHDGDNFYVIDCGVFDVLVTPPEGGQPNIIHQFHNHGSFGELALLYNMPRSATVIADENGGLLWAMDRSSFRRIVLKSAFKKRQKYEALLQSLPMLEFLEPYERMNLADALTSRTYTAGSCVIRQNDKDADGMFFVESGSVRVTLTNDNFVTETEIVSKMPTTYFGEMALVENQPRSASVYASDTGDIRVAFLERESFERLLGPCLDIMKRNMATYETTVSDA